MFFFRFCLFAFFFYMSLCFSFLNYLFVFIVMKIITQCWLMYIYSQVGFISWLEIDNEGRLKTKLHDKRDDFSFPIVNFPFLSSNIPASPAHGVYISQLIRYSRACISYHDFLDRGLLLTRKLSNQEFQMVELKSFLRKFYGRHHELVNRYGITVSKMISDMFLQSPSLSWMWPTEFDYLPDLFSHKQHDGCHMWSRICLPFQSRICLPFRSTWDNP